LAGIAIHNIEIFRKKINYLQIYPAKFRFFV